MNNIKYSVIITLYNEEKYIKECLESVKAQSYKNLEVIVINDGSTDASLEIITNTICQDDRFKVINQKNTGVLGSRVNGIKEASGTYLLFLDGDDYWDSTLVERVNDAIVTTGSDLVMFRYKRVNDSGIVLSTQNSLFDTGTIITDRLPLVEILVRGSELNNIACKAVHIDLVDTNVLEKYLQVSVGEDLLQSVLHIFKSKRTTYINEPLYSYRFVSDSMSGRFIKDSYKHVTMARGFLLSHLEKYGFMKSDIISTYYTNYLSILCSYVIRLYSSEYSFNEKNAVVDEISKLDLFKKAHLEKDTSLSFLNRIVMKYITRKKYYNLYILSNLLTNVKLVGKKIRRG